MIVGIGSDLCDIQRVEKTLARFGERFIDRCFTLTEQRRSDRRAGRAASYAKRFAAKEACAKALGTGLRRGVFWRDMGVVNLPSGQPTMRLTGGAAERLRAILPPGTEPFIHLTITDEKGLAQAFVVIEARAGRARAGRAVPPPAFRPPIFQAWPKSHPQIHPSLGPNPCNFLQLASRIEPFQRLAPTGGQKILSPSSSAQMPLAGSPDSARTTRPRYHAF